MTDNKTSRQTYKAYYHARLRAGAKNCCAYLKFARWYIDEIENSPKCYYCNASLELGTSNLHGFTIDRLDPKEGYFLENMVACCRRCNMVKGNWFTEEQMLDIMEHYTYQENE